MCPVVIGFHWYRDVKPGTSVIGKFDIYPCIGEEGATINDVKLY